MRMNDYPKDYTQYYFGDEEAFKLGWLSFPQIDQGVYPSSDEVFELIACLAIDHKTKGKVTFGMRELLKRDSLHFVDAMMNHPNLNLLPYYRKHGQPWIDTMWTRALETTKMKEVAAAVNVVMVNFKDKRKMG
jgi:hypothetical protein